MRGKKRLGRRLWQGKSSWEGDVGRIEDVKREGRDGF